MSQSDLPRCPSCFRNDNVRPLTLGRIGDGGGTVEYECSACAKVFKPKPVESGFLAKGPMA